MEMDKPKEKKCACWAGEHCDCAGYNQACRDWEKWLSEKLSRFSKWVAKIVTYN